MTYKADEAPSRALNKIGEREDRDPDWLKISENMGIISCLILKNKMDEECRDPPRDQLHLFNPLDHLKTNP